MIFCSTKGQNSKHITHKTLIRGPHSTQKHVEVNDHIPSANNNNSLWKLLQTQSLIRSDGQFLHSVSTGFRYMTMSTWGIYWFYSFNFHYHLVTPQFKYKRIHFTVWKNSTLPGISRRTARLPVATKIRFVEYRVDFPPISCTSTVCGSMIFAAPSYTSTLEPVSNFL